MMGSRDRRIVLLGKTGLGKSSAGNTIFGEENVFWVDPEPSPSSTTCICQTEIRTQGGRNITLIDPPGFFNTEIKDEDQLKAEIVKCIGACVPGPHAFIIVLEKEEYGQQEKDIIEMIEDFFSAKTFDYATVLFTHGDELDEGQTIEEFVNDSKDLRALVQRCGNRCHVIDNEHWTEEQEGYRSNRVQVEKLLNTIDKMVESNKGGFYTNKAL